MKLGSLKHGRDGTLVVVSKDLTRAVPRPASPPPCRRRSTIGRTPRPGSRRCTPGSRPARLPRRSRASCRSPTRSHGAWSRRRCRGPTSSSTARPICRTSSACARRAAPRCRSPSTTDPLMYQAVSAGFYGPRDPVVVPDEAYGIDLEAEIVIVTDDVPMAVTPDAGGAATSCWWGSSTTSRCAISSRPSLRKASASCRASRVRRCRRCWSRPMSWVPPGAMPRSTCRCAAGSTARGSARPRRATTCSSTSASSSPMPPRARPLVAGTIVGSGTVANQDEAKGASCFAEKRMLEIIRDGKPSTPFMKFGDVVKHRPDRCRWAQHLRRDRTGDAEACEWCRGCPHPSPLPRGEGVRTGTVCG